MLLRQEREAEFPAIYDLVKTAFETARVSNGDEQNFVARLRAGGNYIPELALVAEEEGKLIGHIMLTRTFIETAARPAAPVVIGPPGGGAGASEPGSRGALSSGSFTPGPSPRPHGRRSGGRPGLLQPLQVPAGQSFWDRQHQWDSRRQCAGI